ncbi:dihydrodipicolinate synthase family protein [Actinospica sp. MGRD01-02]|uniref:Dihydrodipicolinate synthase family protein n=1 Tax=Actinospica acidithermotolerans TaxID=2828514 RepID=A0A941IFK8_9ACTN|nr:dihydrodipicolinate synthase family protein [Actinospica acidithermotolerans]MBR7826440.1 dihydrodipicolinate synthase family protein [Actinospica acidithermotolerans]
MQSDDGTAGTPTPIPGAGPGDFARQRRALRGVVAIPVTPFEAGDEGRLVDWERHGALIERLVAAGVGAITPNGNTGEFYTLEPAEARRATENTVKQVGERAAIIVGVGLDTTTAINAARHAREVGASMVMVHQPVHPYISGEGWSEYHRRIAEAVPELGIVLYVRDARISGAQIARLGELCPNVIGIKYSVPDPVRFASVAMDAGAGRFEWVAGLAELSAPGYFAMGATGFTSGLVNVVPAISLDFYRELAAGDYGRARSIWGLIRPFEELRAADSSADNVSVVKEALAQLGLCRADVRPPSRPLPRSVRDHIEAILASWGERWTI